MMFKCEIVEDKERSGSLKACGVRWSEARIFWERLLNIVANLLLFIGVPVALWGAACLVLGERGAAIIVPGGILAGAGYGLAWLAANMGGVQRELWFYRDGTIRAPFGLAGNAHHTSIAGHVSDVVSIEAVQVVTPQPPAVAFYPHGVKLYKRNGQIRLVARHLDPEQAHMLAVKLTTALTALREDMIGGVIRNAAARPGRRKAENVFID
ncbi:MAG: hypothetical protein NW215_13160 [Hyphomicrobiales bacterium]|nr:hypothetical protein [Hyphomicrobiales bacterium]